MTCKDCLHCEVCEDSGTNYSKNGGAEHCYFYLNEKEMLKNFVSKLYDMLTRTRDEISEVR